jgi:LacI family transcriptional regulator, galactose operon repressor
VATVSRVLNNYPDVSAETRERVLEGIRESKFLPDRTARSLVTGRSQVIGIILETGAGHPDLQHPFFQEVLVGLKHTVASAAYDLLLFATERPGTSVEAHSYLRRMQHHRIDGVILMGTDHRDPLIQEVVQSGVPCMAVDLGVEGGRTGYVTSNNVQGGMLAVQHLHELGHRRIALIGGPGDTLPGGDRLLGYRREIEQLGLPYRSDHVRVGDFYPDSGYAAMDAFLNLPETPTAVVAAADLMAAGAIQCLADRGLRAPDDVAIVGFDDIPLAGLLQPALTTIRQDKEGLGAAAGQAVVRMIADPEFAPPVVTLPVELVVRESTAGAGVGRGRGTPMG